MLSRGLAASTTNRGSLVFDPVPALKRGHGDVSVVGIFPQALRSMTPIDDPVYAFHRQHNVYNSENLGKNDTEFWADQPGGIIGCIEQVSPLTELADSR